MKKVSFTWHTNSVSSVAFSLNGQQIVSGSGDHMPVIHVWNSTTGLMKEVSLTGHTEWINSAAFSPDGQWIVSGSYDHTIRVWNVTKGLMKGVSLTGNTSWVNSVAFSQDKQQIISGSSDGMVHVYINEAVIDNNILVDFTDQSIVNSDGWICGPIGELLVYIPLIHRTSLHRPSNVWISGAHPTSLDLSSFVHGQNWAACLNPGILA